MGAGVAYRYRRAAAMTVLVEPFASVYDDRSRIGVILACGGRGFEAYAADDHSLGLFPSPRKAAAAITRRAHGPSGDAPIGRQLGTTVGSRVVDRVQWDVAAAPAQ